MADFSETPCWLWPAGKNGAGYGLIGDNTLAHRRAYEAFVGHKQKDIAADYGIDPSHVSKIVTGKRWTGRD